jgi:hypothetical protein
LLQNYELVLLDVQVWWVPFRATFADVDMRALVVLLATLFVILAFGIFGSYRWLSETSLRVFGPVSGWTDKDAETDPQRTLVMAKNELQSVLKVTIDREAILRAEMARARQRIRVESRIMEAQEHREALLKQLMEKGVKTPPEHAADGKLEFTLKSLPEEVAASQRAVQVSKQRIKQSETALQQIPLHLESLLSLRRSAQEVLSGLPSELPVTSPSKIQKLQQSIKRIEQLGILASEATFPPHSEDDSPSISQ